MNHAALKSATQDIVVEEVFPHEPATIWKTLSTGDLIGRWLMKPTGFEPIAGKPFTFQTTPAGQWDGVIHCRVLEAVPNERLVYSWQGGHESNAGYGSPLNTVVTLTLEKAQHGTLLRLIHSGFATPRNDSALEVMGKGWKKIMSSIATIFDEQS